MQVAVLREKNDSLNDKLRRWKDNVREIIAGKEAEVEEQGGFFAVVLQHCVFLCVWKNIDEPFLARVVPTFPIAQVAEELRHALDILRMEKEALHSEVLVSHDFEGALFFGVPCVPCYWKSFNVSSACWRFRWRLQAFVVPPPCNPASVTLS